ncbi:hypothetical protein B0H21DRAFT_823505 [Amylocystis lapponica]|nr:hypothetical protein B0H21DRAFT_823505 [Amylocystis lapponica]
MALSNIHDSPVKFATRQSFHSGLLPKVDVIRKELLTAMSGKFVNMKFDKFMDTFVRNELGPVKPPPPKKWKGKFNAITNGIQEAGLQTNSYALPYCPPGYKMISSPDRADQTDSFGQKADGGVYASSEAPKDNRTCWATKALSVEFKKASTKDDPFDDKGGQGSSSFEAESIQRRKNRGQIIHYASEVFLRQHRCFLFSIIVLGTSARILRWDRSGTIVTEKFDYRRRPEMICEFLWSFARLSPKAQGYDTTAVRVEKGSPEYDLMDRMAELPEDADRTPWSYIGDYFRSSLAPGWIRYKVTVVDEGESGNDGQDAGDSDNGATGDTVADDPGAGEGSKASSMQPHFFASGVLGRGTRGYVAIDVAARKFVFLKDAWRVKLPGIQREGDVLRFLNAKDVQNIPTVLCHGDIDGQCTLSQVYSEWLDDDDRNPLKEHCHYRLAEYEIGQKLETFGAGTILLKIMWDCLTAHEDAYVKARILHRDISEGNILIFWRQNSEGQIVPCGLLNDWELSKKIPNIDAPQDEGSSGRQPDRTGTWLFLSAMSLHNKWKKIVLQDDLESFFHVLLYMAVRFIPSNCDDVGGFIDRFFEAAVVRKDGEYICGSDKLHMMKSGQIELSGTPGNLVPVPLKFMESKVGYPMNQLIYTLLQWFSAYYREEQARHMSQANHAGSSSEAQPTPFIVPTMPLSLFAGLPTEVSEASFASLTDTQQVLSGRDAELAANLSSHDKIRNLFLASAVRLHHWQPDKIRDRRPELNYNRSKRTSESVLDQDLDLPRPKRPKLSHTDPVSEGYVPEPAKASHWQGRGERCEKAGTFSVSSEPAKASDWQGHQ